MSSVGGSRTVAIWGSCVTRDAFAVPDRAAELEARLPLVHYGARSSWISQNSRPWSGEQPDLATMTSGFGRRMVTEDLTKTVVDRLVEHRPDLVVFDLVDERLPLARFGRTWLTVSDYLQQTALGERALAHADQVSPASDRRRPVLFAAAARRIARRLMRELPQTTFVLNEAPYTTRVGDGTTMEEPKAGWARQLDAAQRPLMETLISTFGPRLVRATPPPEVCLADPDHRWGVTSYHYVQDYYHWLIDTLLAVPVPAATGEPDGPGGAGATGSGWLPGSATLRSLMGRQPVG